MAAYDPYPTHKTTQHVTNIAMVSIPTKIIDTHLPKLGIVCRKREQSHSWSLY